MRQIRRHHWAGRLGSVLAVVTFGLLATAGPALAHNVPISSNPVDGAVLDTAPPTVSLTFNQPIQNFDPVLDVFGPNGNSFAAATPTIDGATVSVPMSAGPAGAYRAAYRVISVDGHPVTGQIAFTLADSAAGTATGTPTAVAAAPDVNDAGNATGSGSSSGGLSAWMWVGIGIAAVLVIGAIGFAVRKPSNPQ